MVVENPSVLRTAHQRLYDMITSFGSEEVTIHKEKVTRYKFFSDPLGSGKDAIYGIERSLAALVDILKAAAYGYGADKRVMLLHGPVGSAKSTIVRLMKRGLEYYSRMKEGAAFSYSWRIEENGEEVLVPDPMHDEPLRLLPPESEEYALVRRQFENLSEE